MKKETFKTIVLALLVTSSIILTINNWFSEKLWPDGYNFFSNLASYFFAGDEPKSYYLSKENVSNPTKIIVTNDDLRDVYTHSSSDFNDMVGEVKSFLKLALSQKESAESTDLAWKDALKYKSIYFSYPVSYEAKTFSAILDTPINAVADGVFQEFVLVSGDNITGKAHLLVKNSQSGNYHDITINSDTQRIDHILQTYARSSTGEYPYSFELNFDKSDSSAEQKITIDSQVILSIKERMAPTVSEINYFDTISENDDLYTEFLRSVGFNVSNIRKHINTDGSIVFAENYGTIKMYPDGLLEFKSLNDTNGIQLGESTEFYDTFIDTIEFVNNIWDTACFDENMNINLSSVKLGSQDNSFSLTIDYFADGMEVVTSLEATDSHEKMDHAIEIQVINSKVVSYRQVVKGYRSNGDATLCTNVIEALDILMAKESIRSDKITDLYLAYYADPNGICSPYWVAKTAKNEIRIIKDK